MTYDTNWEGKRVQVTDPRHPRMGCVGTVTHKTVYSPICTVNFGSGDFPDTELVSIYCMQVVHEEVKKVPDPNLMYIRHATRTTRFVIEMLEELVEGMNGPMSEDEAIFILNEVASDIGVIRNRITDHHNLNGATE